MRKSAVVIAIAAPLAACASRPQHEPMPGAHLLALMWMRAERENDDVTRDDALARVLSPRFASTQAAVLVKGVKAQRERYVVSAGDPFPDLGIAAQRLPALYYITSLRCGRCKTNLPKLREFAAARPEVQVVVLLWDEEPDAIARLQQTHAPVPGLVVQPDEALRSAIEASVMQTMAFPSHILVDAEGVVVATSNDASLSDLTAVRGDAP